MITFEVGITCLRRLRVTEVTIMAISAAAVSVTPTTITIESGSATEEKFYAFIQVCREAPKPTTTPALAVNTPTPIPAPNWPVWALTVKGLRKPEDKGVGSTIARLLGSGGVILKAALTVAGIQCGCDARQAEWDVLYPYA